MNFNHLRKINFNSALSLSALNTSFLSLFLMLSGMVVSVHGQTNKVSFEILEEGRGTPIKEVTVKAYKESDSLVLSSVNALASFENVIPGKYYVQITPMNQSYPDTLIHNIEVIDLQHNHFKIELPFNCIYVKDKNVPTCTHCGKTDRVIPVRYGYPTQKLINDERMGKVIIAGCSKTRCSPIWFCKRERQYL